MLKGLFVEGVLGEVVYFEFYFDCFCLQVCDCWCEQGGLGSGIWYDLVLYFFDQVITFFGLLVSMMVDLVQLWFGVQLIDYFYVILFYLQW